MNSYICAIKSALLFIPLLGLIFLIPYMIIKYKKHGKIETSKLLIFYFFILYLIVMYLLVILPLPPIEEVKNYTKEYTQLKPLYTITYLKENQYFHPLELNTYIKLIKNAYFYQFLYNILLTIPLGIYLRKYFKCNLTKTILYTFLLSLFFELTQLTGLYGIYPRPYRIFDVDDLITNNLGGLIGYTISSLLFRQKDS